MPPNVTVLSPGEEKVTIEMTRTSQYARAIIDQYGRIMDNSDPMEPKILATLEAFKEERFTNCRIDPTGCIVDKRGKIQAYTFDFPEIYEELGYKPIDVGYLRAVVAKRWGWPLDRLRLRLSGGGGGRTDLIPLDDEAHLIEGTIFVATRSPCRVSASLQFPCSAGGAAAVGPDRRADFNVTLAVGYTTVADLKNRLATRVGVPMAFFFASAACAAEASTDSELRQKTLGIAEDLDATAVHAVLLRPKPQIFRLLVELRNRDALWRAGKNGEGRLGAQPLARLEVSQREIGLVLTRELCEVGCTTNDGVLTITLPNLTEDMPVHFLVAASAPRGCIYEGSILNIKIELPPEWPKIVPRAQFLPPLYPRTVHEDGVLPAGALGLFEDDWKPSNTVFDYLGVLMEHIASPV